MIYLFAGLMESSMFCGALIIDASLSLWSFRHFRNILKLIYIYINTGENLKNKKLCGNVQTLVFASDELRNGLITNFCNNYHFHYFVLISTCDVTPDIRLDK